jgi:hypothetical protein
MRDLLCGFLIGLITLLRLLWDALKTWFTRFFPFLCLLLCLAACSDPTHISAPLRLDVPYPCLYSAHSFVRGGQCGHGAILLVAGYLQGFTPTQADVDRAVAFKTALTADTLPDLASALYGLPLRLQQVTPGTLSQELSAQRPVILLLPGDGGTLDAVVCVGLTPDSVLLHYPAWSWPEFGTGAYREVGWERFLALHRQAGCWGYVVTR